MSNSVIIKRPYSCGNRSAFGKVMVKSTLAPFFSGHKMRANE